MDNDQNYFFYPADLKKKTLFLLWTGPMITLNTALLIFSTLVFFLTFAYFPLVITLIVGLLTASFDERSVLDYLKDYLNYLFLDQLDYTWGEPAPILNKEASDEKTAAKNQGQ